MVTRECTTQRSLMQARRLAARLTQRASRSASSAAGIDLNERLETSDPDLFDIMEHEKKRQRESLSLIASENFTSRAVLDGLGSVMSNKYSEGYPGARYYGGNEYIDQVEFLCQARALEAFNLDPEKWGVNVQSLSGSPANFQVYTALLEPKDRILALDLPHGGHLSHGYQTATKKISAVSTYFETFAYSVNSETHRIDHGALDAQADLVRPKLIVAGTSAYSRLLEYEQFRATADKHKAWLLADMAHISGLVAAGVVPTPFDYADVVTTTTHKSLRGPRGAMIFYRKGERFAATKKKPAVAYDIEEKLNFAVFPGLQGGPHNHTITALATALKQANTPEFKAYQERVVANARAFSDAMVARGYSLVSGGTDNHMVVVDTKKSKGIDGARVESVFDLINISLNKNTVPTDTSALVPSGVRVGSPALTSRGFDEADFADVARFIDAGVSIALEVAAEARETGKTLKAFKSVLAGGARAAEITALQSEVAEFAKSFPTVGFAEDEMRYK